MSINMSMKWKGITKIGLMSGAEYGAPFFRAWRCAKARQDFIEDGVDFIIFAGGLINVEHLTARFLNEHPGEKLAQIPQSEKIDFAWRIAQEIAEVILPPLDNGSLVKYWVWPSPLFEIKKDKYGLVKMVYDVLPLVAKERHNLDAPYIRVNHNELVEIEDEVAIRTIGVITPSGSPPFRARVLSTPIEREIAYRQHSGLGSIPDLYVAGMFAVAMNELNPRSVPKGKPYVSIPSLAIEFKEGVLQNSLGFAILTLYPEYKNRAQYEIDFRLLNDAIFLECAFAKDALKQLADETQRRLVAAIVDKLLIGTKVTVGKLEDQLKMPREQVIATIKSLVGTPFEVSLDENLGEIRNPHSVIPSTNEDLTRYRSGKVRKKSFVAGACAHIGDAGVDYDFLENDLPQIVFSEEAKTVYMVGDLTEGNKYDQDRRKELIIDFSLPSEQQILAGHLFAKALFNVYEMNFQDTHQIESSLPAFVFCPGNHDEHSRNEPPLQVFHRTLLEALTGLLFGYLKKEGYTDYEKVAALVKRKVVFLSNPNVYREFGLIHEHMGSSEQSTHKGQKSLKQFQALSDAEVILLGNYHELNMFLMRIGDKSIASFNLGTLKRLSSFEGKRSKITEFGIAACKIVFQDCGPTQVAVKFIPSRISFKMSDAGAFIERNRDRGRAYAKKYLDNK